MGQNQDTSNSIFVDKSSKISKKQLKNTALGKEVLEKYTPKKDLNRKVASFMEKHLSFKSVVRFETCSDYMTFLTNEGFTSKRLHRANSCGNRFCPICTWKRAKKDAIKMSVMMEAVKEIERKEFLFLTLTAPNFQADELGDKAAQFNSAVSKLFRRRNVARVVKGYIRKLEVTTDQEQLITDELYKRKNDYFDRRGLKVGDPNPQYNTYNPHMHIIIAVNKSYFNKPTEYISQSEWLSMWQECMGDSSITQVDVRKVRDSEKSQSNAVLEVAKYSAKGSDLYHSEAVFDTFYIGLRKRQLLVYSGLFKDYAKKYENGDLDNFKKQDETVYTHLLKSLWAGSSYENKLRELTPEEFQEFNKRALYIDEDEDIE
ncbi:protein rep [Lysinibacillus sp. D3C2_S12]|uniref:protein rep n=1 Tax=Lysinibacillus sp. D3C2_S12 TaxID=2941226 RepID=UPI0020C01D83|nr:protein rep [Lysinibacillus sp. D3C2_S12]